MKEVTTSVLTNAFKIPEISKEIYSNALLNLDLKSDEGEMLIKELDNNSRIFLSLNRNYERGRMLKYLSEEGLLNSETVDIFSKDFNLYMHQENTIISILKGLDTIISTGTGSGKTESFLIPIINYCLENKSRGVKAVLIYPMNALANDQLKRIEDKIRLTELKCRIFSGEVPTRDKCSAREVTREDIIEELPDILITNHVMLDRILTNSKYKKLIENSSQTLKYIVVDEIHTYRGNKATHLKYLLQRLKYYFKYKPVQIGCSATLASGNNENKGYIFDETLDDFIKPLFNVKSYSFIKPIYEKMKEIPEEVLSNFISSYGRGFSRKDVINIRDGLAKKSLSLEDISELTGLEISKLKELLIGIQRFNDNNSSPLVDFKVHLFIKDIGTSVKRCIGCGKYYATSKGICSSCGFPLFNVCKDDIKKCIGKISNRRLKNELREESDDSIESYYVFIEFNNEFDDIYGLRFIIKNVGTDGAIKLSYSRDGNIKLVFSEILNSEKIKDFCLNVLSENEKYKFLTKIIRCMLNDIRGEHKKLLTFIDNRENVSKYYNLMTDSLYSELFEEIFNFSIGEIKKPLDEAFNMFRDIVEVVIQEDKEKKYEFLKEYKKWFARWLLSPEGSSINRVYLDDSTNITEDEVKILDILLKERIYNFKADNIDTKGVIRFGLKSLAYRRGVCIKPVEADNYKKLSLGEQGQKYRSIIKSIDTTRAFEGLISKSILKEHEIKDLFYLNPTKFLVEGRESLYNSVYEIIEDLKVKSGGHSSEVDKNEKKIIEEEFQEAEINSLFSTSTLEMGIDIGELYNVMLIGVPPMPSNYAQRAGRAGRRNNKFSLIVTICSEDRNHDMFYFERPLEMIEGYITPPRFNPDNQDIIDKHIDAFLISEGELGNKDERMIRLRYVFKSDALDKYDKTLWKKVKGANTETLYKEGLLPDYLFRRDKIKLKDVSDRDKVKEITQYEQELAISKLTPDKREYISNGYYKILPSGEYEEKDDYRIYRTFECCIEDNMQSKEVIHKYETLTYIEPLSSDIKDIVEYSYYESTKITFINNGEIKGKDICRFSENDSKFKLKYEIVRDSIIFKFGKGILPENEIYSFISCTDRAFKDYYGLDEGEIKVIQADNEDPQFYVFVFYDFNGNGSLNLKAMAKNFNKILKYAYEKITTCLCRSNSGCYLCMKSYQTQNYAYYLKKDSALEIISYLLREKRYKPKVWDEYFSGADLTWTVKHSGNRIILIEDEKEFAEEFEGDRNLKIFEILISRLSKIDEEIEDLLIKSNLEYFINALNEDASIKTGSLEFKKLLFNLLRIKNLRAEKL